MYIEQLKTFKKVSELKSFTLASYELNITQSSVSKHIKKLEDHYGVQLFKREGNKIKLTEAGEKLLLLSKEIINLQKESKGIIKDKTLTSEILKIQTDSVAGGFLLSTIISSFVKQFNDIRFIVDIEKEKKETIYMNILQETVHMGLTDSECKENSFICLPLFSEDLKLIVGARHPWSKNPPKKLTDLSGQPFIFLKPAHRINQIVKDAFLECGIIPSFSIEVPESELFYPAIGSNTAISIFTKNITVPSEQYKIKFLDIPELEIKRRFYLIYNRLIVLSQLQSEFLDFIKKIQENEKFFQKLNISY